eukprot:TRINITY_DN12446_c0_g1_i2.p1 TRINITY_DN12446_c0_g1~~TRINITY_DN12446_c0_g1_i2.p1  ORF type:complete len:126 (-),score=8.66 TRINITY_DN12446_c0_g1_i2:16-393(-)
MCIRDRPYWLKRFNNLDTLSSEILIITLSFKELIESKNPITSFIISSAGWIVQLIFYLKCIQLFYRIHREERFLAEQQTSPHPLATTSSNITQNVDRHEYIFQTMPFMLVRALRLLVFDYENGIL